MVQCLIDKTVDLLHDTLTKINGKIVQRTSSKANAFNLMPALTEYITTENSLDRVALHYADTCINTAFQEKQSFHMKQQG